MAMLLKMYQKMKLTREKNLTELKLVEVTSKKDRVTKNIKRTQERYTSLFANIDAQAKMMQSQAKMAFQNMFGLGINNGNYLDPYSFGGLNGFITNAMGQMLMSSFDYKDNKGETHKFNALSAEDYQQMLAEYMQNSGSFIPAYTENADGTRTVKRNETTNQIEYQNWSAEKVYFFQQAMQMAKYQQQQNQMQCNNMSQQYDTNVSVWQEAAKAQLEAEQDAAVEPLTYQETMWDLEKTQLETKLKRIEADLQAYDQSLDQEAKNQAPKFGI